jgi:hypothetical protein
MVLHIIVLCFNHLCKYCFNFYSTELKAKNIFKMVTINNMKLMNSSKLFHPFNNLLQVHCQKKKNLLQVTLKPHAKGHYL